MILKVQVSPLFEPLTISFSLTSRDLKVQVNPEKLTQASKHTSAYDSDATIAIPGMNIAE